MKVNYYDYIRSSEWKDKGKSFKKKVGDRCQAFPWIKLHRYNVHHCSYKNLGEEKWNLDCIVLSLIAHRFVHSWLAGSWHPIGVSEQNRKGCKYPNFLQKMFHWYTRFIGVLLYLTYSSKR